MEIELIPGRPEFFHTYDGPKVALYDLQTPLIEQGGFKVGVSWYLNSFLDIFVTCSRILFNSFTVAIISCLNSHYKNVNPAGKKLFLL